MESCSTPTIISMSIRNVYGTWLNGMTVIRISGLIMCRNIRISMETEWWMRMIGMRQKHSNRNGLTYIKSNTGRSGRSRTMHAFCKAMNIHRTFSMIIIITGLHLSVSHSPVP